MSLDFYNKKYIISSYNEDTEEELDYYLDPEACDIGDIAYMKSYRGLEPLEIVKVIKRSDDIVKYDSLIEDDDILIDGESEYEADTSAEFITFDNCLLVWFAYV